MNGLGICQSLVTSQSSATDPGPLKIAARARIRATSPKKAPLRPIATAPSLRKPARNSRTTRRATQTNEWRTIPRHITKNVQRRHTLLLRLLDAERVVVKMYGTAENRRNVNSLRKCSTNAQNARFLKEICRATLNFLNELRKKRSCRYICILVNLYLQ